MSILCVQPVRNYFYSMPSPLPLEFPILKCDTVNIGLVHVL